MSAEGTKEEYPWYSAINIRKWIEIELEHPKRSWTIDNYEGAESYVELGVKPVPRKDAGKNMAPEKSQMMRRQLQGGGNGIGTIHEPS